MNDKTLSIYRFLQEINKFKEVERLSLITENGRRESDAEHTWHLTMAVWLYSDVYEKKIDLLKAAKLALVHDLVEIYAGDVYGGATADVRAGKEERELAAAQKLFTQLDGDAGIELMTLWHEYEARETEEAKYVWALDKISPQVQLTITKTDASEGMPTDHEKVAAQQARIREISPALGEVLDQTKKDRGLS